MVGLQANRNIRSRSLEVVRKKLQKFLRGQKEIGHIKMKVVRILLKGYVMNILAKVIIVQKAKAIIVN